MKLHHIALALLVVAIWGFNFVMIHFGLQEVSPLSLSFMRFFLACFPLIFFVKRPNCPFMMVVAYALIIFVLKFSLLFIGMAEGMTAGLASLLTQTQAFFTILLAVIFLNERPNRWQLLGALIAFTGIGVVGMNLGEHATFIGFVLMIASATAWGVANIIVKKMGNIDMFSLVVWSSFIAWPPLLGIALVFEGTEAFIHNFQQLSWQGISSILFIAYPTTIFGYAMWNVLLSRYPTATIAPFTLLVPVFGMLSSNLILEESLDSWKIIAALLIIGGLCINIFGPKLFGKKINKAQAMPARSAPTKSSFSNNKHF